LFIAPLDIPNLATKRKRRAQGRPAELAARLRCWAVAAPLQDEQPDGC
jgi:hypothetical protein